MLKDILQKITFPRLSLWLVGLMFVLPFLGKHHLLPIPSFYNEWFAAVLGLAALMLFLRNRYWQDMTLPVIALVPLGLIVVLLIQMPTDRIIFPEHNVLGASYLLWAVLLMLLSGTLVRELGMAEVVETLAWFLVCGAVLNAGIAVFQVFGVDTVFDPYVVKKARVPFANIGQPNHFSNLVALGLGSLLYLMSRRRLHWGTVAVCGSLLLYVLSFSGSRSSWLYVTAMFVLALGFFAAGRQPETRRLVIVTMVLIPGFALAQHLVPGGIATPTENLFNLAGSKSDRLAIWYETWQIFLQSPLLGIGFGEFVWQHFLLSVDAPQVIRGALYNHCHNIVLQVLAEMGLPAAALLVAGSALWFWRIVRLGVYTPEHWWVLALAAILAIHSMLEYPLWYTYFLGIAAILLGVGEVRFFRLSLERVGRALFVLVFLLGCMSLFNLGKNYSGFEDAFYGIGKSLSTKSGIELREEKADIFVKEVLNIHQESLLGAYAEIAVSHGIRLNEENLKEKLAVNSRAMHAAPIKEIAYRQAILLGLNKEHQAAAFYFDLAAAAYPREVDLIIPFLKSKASRNREGFQPLVDHAVAWRGAHPDPSKEAGGGMQQPSGVEGR